MKKAIFASFIVLVAMQLMLSTQAFIVKTVSLQKAYVPYAIPTYATIPASDASIAAYTASKNALVQSVSNAVTEKINALTALVNSVVQAKIAAKRNLWLTTVNAGTNVVNGVNGILVAKPTVYTKTVSVGFKPLFTTAVVPVVPITTTATGVVTTTSAQPGGYKLRRYSYA